MIRYPGKSVVLTNYIPQEAISWRNMKEIWRWCRQNTLLSSGEHAAWLSGLGKDPSIKMFGVKTAKDSQDIGVCGLTSINRLNQTAEFSLYIAPNSQGLGYGKDALYSLIRHGFYDLNLNRIFGETYDGNPALKMFLGLGMTQEGTLRESYYRDGKFINSHLVSILRKEFMEKYQ